MNNNKSIDVGLFQLNSIHFKKGYTLKDFADCEKNIKIAYEIFKRQGFTPWVAYTSGAYKRSLKLYE